LRRLSFTTQTRTAGGDNICLAPAAEVNAAVRSRPLFHSAIIDRSAEAYVAFEEKNFQGSDQALEAKRKKYFPSNSRIATSFSRRKCGYVSRYVMGVSSRHLTRYLLQFMLGVINEKDD
jgi:hypothetical protein